MMHILYNSDNYTVAAIQLAQVDSQEEVRGGYEIMDKATGKGIYLEGDMARQFQREVEQIAKDSSEGEDLEAYLQHFELLMHQVVQN